MITHKTTFEGIVGERVLARTRVRSIVVRTILSESEKCRPMAETVWGADQIERQHYTAECTGSGEYDFLCKRVSDTDPGGNLYVSADPPKRSNGRTK